MTSIHSSSDAAIASEDISRPQAGPLPSKRGEIGYVEGAEITTEAQSSIPEIVLPATHPADRDAPANVSTAPEPTNPTTSPSANTLVSPSSATLVSTESNNSTSKKQRILRFFKSKKIPTIFGFSLKTLFLFFLQVSLIGGSIAGWALSVKYLSQKNPDAEGFNTTAIFMHVVFGVAVLGQLLFIERRIFRLRAERWSYLHPGEILPISLNRRAVDASIAFSPWNRPPLPTYAAALAQSGVGTGDVEDHLIAAPPPPAYGNTRGSTLLLSGFLRNSLRAQRPVSNHSQMSDRERPVSYVSRDERWEEIQDAERARQVEETLTQLERPAPAVTTSRSTP